MQQDSGEGSPSTPSNGPDPWAPPNPANPWAAPTAAAAEGSSAAPSAQPYPWIPPMPTRPPGPPRRAWWRRRLVLGVGAGGLALAVAAGVLVWRGGEDAAAADAANRAPFYLAVYNLFGEPAVHYTGSASGDTSWDLTVTADDETLGTVTSEGNRFDLLAVGGRTYLKPPSGRLADYAGSTPRAMLEGKWLTGNPALTDLVPELPGSPSTFASRLWTALDMARHFPAAGAAPTRVDGQDALTVSTSLGTLAVSATAPYRVLRIDPEPSAKNAAALGGPTRIPVAPAAAPDVVSAAGQGPGTVALSPLAPAEVGQTYDALIDRTKTLSSAVDLGVGFDFNQTGNLACSDSCTVTEHVTTSTTAGRSTKLTGNVTAVLNADVTLNGEAAGSCSQTAELPLNGSGTISCVDSAIAPVVAKIKAQKQQEADQQAQAQGRNVTLQYTLDFRAQVSLTAVAQGQAEVDQEVKGQQTRKDQAVRTAQDNAGQQPDCGQDSFLAGTGVLAADGSAVPIQELGAGDRVRNAVAGATDLQAHPVDAVVVTDTDRDFVALGVDGPQGGGELGVTAHHLFYDLTTAAWTPAAELHPGDLLQSTGTARATVRSVHPYRGAARTFNLSVAGVHSYFVLAGGTPVLVHNCPMKRDAKALKGVKVPRTYEGLDIAHTRQNHVPGKDGLAPGKDAWPATITDAQLEDIARQALRNTPRVIGYDPNTGMVQAVAMVNGIPVQFQIPRGGGQMRSIYPLRPWPGK
ncbi:Hint domain-containing protein [Kitasatospora cinereorecta]|uniref:Hint domain-containing protein n=1 Tax=Kitasatospora cinereorecta TaxID=285560 RepID=A0ABW0VFF0_9ACTN